jgi:hypothetical protein
MNICKIIIQQNVIEIEGQYYCITDVQAREGIEAGLPIQHIPIEKEVRYVPKRCRV